MVAGEVGGPAGIGSRRLCAGLVKRSTKISMKLRPIGRKNEKRNGVVIGFRELDVSGLDPKTRFSFDGDPKFGSSGTAEAKKTAGLPGGRRGRV
jgi:hypothetical protein